MPARSKAQRRLFAIAEHDPGASAEAGRLAKSLSKSQLHDFAATKEKGLPMHKKQGRRANPRGGSRY